MVQDYGDDVEQTEETFQVCFSLLDLMLLEVT